MKIVVCIKRVPDTEARIRIGEGGATIDVTGVKFVISPYDEYALESALRLKEARGEGEIVVISLGPGAAAEQLRAALAMGADRAVLLEAEPGMDGLATARALAGWLAAENADLILTGIRAVDDDQQQVGPMLAELLDLPCATLAAEVEFGDGAISATREVEGGVEVVEVTLPAVVTITKGPFEPRYPSLKGIMAAKKKPFEQTPAELASARVEVRELVYPPERPPGRIVGHGVDAVPELVRLLHDEARVL